MIDVTEIEKRVDKAIAAPVPVNADLGGVRLENLGQVMEFAKLMSLSGVAVPKWLRGNPGGCLAICSRALRWGMDPFAVAEQSYQAIGKGGIEHLGFMSQLIHAVITANAPLKGRLRSEIIGTGDDRRCKVWGTFRGETKPHEYTSETLGKKIAAIGVNDKGELKGSPLWRTDPDVQLTYSAVRQWCRLHSSETILGVYAPDELESEPVDDVVSSLSQRLRDAKMASVGARGFDVAHVASVIEGEATQEAEDENKPRDESRRMDDQDRRDGVADQKGSDRGSKKPEAPRADVARQRAETKSTAQGEIFPRTPPRNPPQEDRPDSPRGYVSKPKIAKTKGRRR